ncbi:fasciclin-like arabinogalactan protein 12 [Macadamia integrifolia]|uniref:fasciclin-like arabinogalactan protein 12 n=1 Tax=Macadamia integrifolia TaxID=60698 RepID=UPI001C529A9F|nr:fasciclin-like arabinogalactan protein 12 [Macadamia integrifolia]
MNMRKQLHLQHSSSVLLIMITLLFTTTLALSPTIAPAPSGPTPPSPAPPSLAPSSPAPKPHKKSPAHTNITAILEKAGKFNIFIRLLKSTGLGEQINSQLKKSNQGLTLFAPPDTAFSYLPQGTLNSFSGQQLIELVQFHELPNYVPIIQFQTMSNPIVTQAGNSYDGQFPLNVSTSGQNVSIDTGVVKANVDTTIYSDGQFAVYEVDKVLLPLEFHVSQAPVTAMAPSKPKMMSFPSSDAPSISSVVSSIAVRIIRYIGVSFAVAVIAL